MLCRRFVGEDGYCRFFFFSSRRRHTRCLSDWSSDVCSSDLARMPASSASRYSTWPIVLGWAQLLALFRMIYDGAESGSMRLPKRHGVLFNPDRFPFLEGRASGASRQPDECIEPPLVPDGDRKSTRLNSSHL